MSRSPRVRVEIGRLVLAGVAPRDREALAAGLEAALSRQLAEAALAQGLGASRNVASLRVGRIAGGGGARQLGERAANVLVRGLSK